MLSSKWAILVSAGGEVKTSFLKVRNLNILKVCNPCFGSGRLVGQLLHLLLDRVHRSEKISFSISTQMSGETVIFLTPFKLPFVKSLANLLLSETSNTDSQNFAKTKAKFLNEVKTSIFLQHFDISNLGCAPPLFKSFDHTSNICSISYL